MKKNNELSRTLYQNNDEFTLDLSELASAITRKILRKFQKDAMQRAGGSVFHTK